ncbi:MAG: thiolase family protein [Rhodothermales bacterium]|nr:thiolase family protein [Rhodothermales bacterium]
MEAKGGAFIVSSVRTPVGKANRGSLRSQRPEALGALVVKEALSRAKGIDPTIVDDVLVGCAMPEGPQGLNVARLIVQKAGLPDSVPAATINRFCSSGLQTIVSASQAITAGHSDVIVAGGVESMSMVPMSGFYFSADPGLVDSRIDAYISMGNTAENVAETYEISRADQDSFSIRSHERAIDAIQAGRFDKETVPVPYMHTSVNGKDRVQSEGVLERDEGPRPDSSLEALARLSPVFRRGGSVTAGNSSQLSDGAAAAVIVSERILQEYAIEPLARIVGFAVAGVPPEIMGIGPIPAVRKVLKQTNLSLADIGLIELNEAFASQSLAVIRELELNADIVNVNGGAIALGHPLGCTGAKLTATLIHEMNRRGERYGICTMCIGGGMGAAAVIENLMI